MGREAGREAGHPCNVPHRRGTVDHRVERGGGGGACVVHFLEDERGEGLPRHLEDRGRVRVKFEVMVMARTHP